jgi:hypothetical protein
VRALPDAAEVVAFLNESKGKLFEDMKELADPKQEEFPNSFNLGEVWNSNLMVVRDAEKEKYRGQIFMSAKVSLFSIV